MEQISNVIRVGWSDPGLNEMLGAIGGETAAFSRHFNQFGDFFLLLGDGYEVPSVRIHHDVRQTRPDPRYLDLVRATVASLARLAPQVFRGLRYFFDPTETLRPCFFQVGRQGDDVFLYLLRLDLALKPSEGEVVERGTNDTTAHWTSRKLFLEPTIVPLLEEPVDDVETRGFRTLQAISETWIGEVKVVGGIGYEKQGVWMDPRLSRFFSSLFLPPGADLHPFQPFLCHYKTVCGMPLDLAPEGRQAAIPRLQRALAFLLPVMDRIQAALGTEEFSEQLPIYSELKQKVPAQWYEPWRSLRVEAYLNENDRKEYRLDG